MVSESAPPVDAVPSYLYYCPDCNEYHYRHNKAAQERTESVYEKQIEEARHLSPTVLEKIIGALKAPKVNLPNKDADYPERIFSASGQTIIGWVFGIRPGVVRAINARPVVDKDRWRAISPRSITEEDVAAARERDKQTRMLYQEGFRTEVIARKMGLHRRFVEERVWDLEHVIPDLAEEMP